MSQTRKQRFDDLVRMGELFIRSDIDRERALLTSKWFDYRFMSPWEGTELFVLEYQKAYRRAFASWIDKGRAASVAGASLSQLNDVGMRTQIWRARQRADETGMPYPEYMEASFEFWRRRSVKIVAGKRKKRMLLSMSQLHHPGAAASYWFEFWTTFWSERLDDRVVQMPEAVAYRLEYFRDLPAQVNFRDRMTRIAAASQSSPMGWMMVLSHVKQQIPLEAFTDVLGDDVFQHQVERLRSDVRHYGTASEPLPPLTSTGDWQSCFGLVAPVKECAPCSACPQQDSCAGMAALVDAALKKKTGSADPVRERKLKLQRARQQRYRQKRAGSPPSTSSFP
ncbi:hypothetical protein RB623_21560 [Mesorhizobium sp. LHD-90]|uniref:hypothetical protein n=1 Tax=Mesorhizobium sp. LHD-90 TaxID=3071414 RepID=UPI0027E1DE3C|nr:hypothetical protein [Mesorhizobium sp. LHD-90]MDQ6436645.1 hypothetical protein [Mesorhizobium sp. LHD-90]